MPAEHAIAVRLGTGDRITLHADIIADDTAPSDYRTAPPLRTRGVPVLVQAARADGEGLSC